MCCKCTIFVTRLSSQCCGLAAFVNAMEEVLSKSIGNQQKGDDGMDEDMTTDEEQKRVDSYDLEDFQRHYRSVSLSHSSILIALLKS